MKIRILLKSFDNTLFNEAVKELIKTVSEAQCTIHGTITLPVKKKRFCVLRSPHIDKKSREHFEVRIYKQFFDIDLNSPETLNLLLAADIPAGVACSLKVL